jgi:hypothetical protein
MEERSTKEVTRESVHNPEFAQISPRTSGSLAPNIGKGQSYD